MVRIFFNDKGESAGEACGFDQGVLEEAVIALFDFGLGIGRMTADLGRDRIGAFGEFHEMSVGEISIKGRA